MTVPVKSPEEPPQRLESKKYNFLVEGTMPVLNFELTSGGKQAPKDMPEINQIQSQNLTLELYTPISGEIFEARTPKGRIEVDNDGTVTYFSQQPDSLSFSLFLGKSITVTMSRKTGEVVLKTPSKILSIEDLRESNKKGKSSEPFTDSIRLMLE
ncbi:MAG: hypothetical protein ACRECH_04195 [Nitrososphaerales archaeon]